MRLLLTMNLPYEPAFGGASKANRAVLELLAQRGHSISVVAPSFIPPPSGKYLTGDFNQRYEVQSFEDVTISEINRVEVHSVDISRIPLRTYLAKYLAKFSGDCIMVSSEDSMQVLLREAVSHAASPIVYLAHTPNCLPFGPASFFPSNSGSSLFHKVSAVIAVSQFCYNYIQRWGGVEPIQLYLPIYGQPPYPHFSNYREGFITMINPCGYKGIDIFLQLSQAHPELQFAGVPSWGTTSNDLQRLHAQPNITILDAHPNIDTILQRTRLILVPSLYLENLPMIIIESMLRGIPVIASNVGGIPEAKLGTDYLLDVHPIERYLNTWDERKLWVPIVPAQDIAPWDDALRSILANEDAYGCASENARQVSTAFAASLSLDPFEDFLESITAGGRR